MSEFSARREVFFLILIFAELRRNFLQSVTASEFNMLFSHFSIVSVLDDDMA